MKRGKDEEKILEPMFPRLHVNDADKGGGPRAPPRNKMALYEQLSIPSQRFNDRTSASFPRNTSTTLVSPGPSNQACGVERNLTGRATDNFVSQMPLMENVRTSSSQQRGDQRKIVREEDDFAVPVFVNSRRSGRSSNKSGIDKEKDTTSKRGGLASSSGRVDGCETTTRVVGVNNGVESHMASEEEEEEEEEGHSGGYTSLQQINEEEASEDVSDDSMVDSVSSVDVSPDDVVGVLGQKRFWRARKAIANQQRVFAVQLFELHRLIKVQRLIAASPDVLLDDISYLGKVAAPVKKLLPSGFIVKPPLPQAIKRRSSDSEKTDQNKMECSAENVVGRLSNQGDHHHHQPSNYMPFATNQPAANGCYYPPPHQPQPQPQPLPSGGNQQWLIPVMSPSEGLIYKPHPGPGHTGPVCGGYYGHFMPAPMVMGSFMGGGGGQPPPFHPGMGFPSHGNNGYFPPYGIMMNPYYSGQQQQQQPPSEQMNNNIQQQSSVNEAASQQQQQQPTKSYPRARKSRQGSTGSSPEGIISGKKNSFRPFSAADKINSAPEEMMTTTTTTTTTVTQTTRDGAGVTRVIKVVPHNANLASENAARIFRSIQEERKQYDDAFADYP
ncbi:Protein EARLY FLOWERING 3 [Raphanus sativus]|uniref:Protein EARLY FLOWERING 3 isoform X2 n=1 Tax=Raphanus sativus TaxID=3726 RepID=A0A6J0K081_RAPSA|nr:protein EARLY FLOWERING 3 isoform X2 [Raphanus sativus]KAJ4890596.1 Protein EARLY FLOWERING 3 [Raphanus sativus]